MIAFLRKAERPEVLRYVHGGWVAALVAGGATWAAATFFISISGASRELTEGFGSLLAAVVLVSVGIWMHGKSHADAWQTYIRDKLSHALSKRSAWFLFLLAFIVVYREVFETILFYAAIWSQGGHLGMLAGALTAVAILAVVAWALLAYSMRLPDRPVLLAELDPHGHPVGRPRRQGRGCAAGGGLARCPSAGVDPPHRDPRSLSDGRGRRRSASDDCYPRGRLLPACGAEGRAPSLLSGRLRLRPNCGPRVSELLGRR